MLFSESSCEQYNPFTDIWTMVARMLRPREDFSMVMYEGKVYAFGGVVDESTAGSGLFVS